MVAMIIFALIGICCLGFGVLIVLVSIFVSRQERFLDDQELNYYFKEEDKKMIDTKKDSLYDEIGICSEYCKNCIHCTSPKTVTERTCNYIIDVGHRRPCPAGKHCTERVIKPSRRKKVENDN